MRRDRLHPRGLAWRRRFCVALERAFSVRLAAQARLSAFFHRRFGKVVFSLSRNTFLTATLFTQQLVVFQGNPGLQPPRCGPPQHRCYHKRRSHFQPSHMKDHRNR